MNKFAITTAVAVALSTQLAAQKEASAQKPDPLELMLESDRRHRLDRERVDLTMILQKRGERPRTRRLEIIRLQDPADRAGDRQRIRFLAPADIKDTRLLTIENKRGDDNQWLYLPAFRRTRRVGTSDLGDRFAGTDFFYEDLRRRRVREYTYKLTGSEDVGGARCWVIESRPASKKTAAESPYARSVIWLREDNLVPVRVRHFDGAGRPMKELRFEKLKRIKGEVWRPDQITAIDVRRKHRTVVAVSTRDIRSPLSADLFDPAGFADR